jgi:hypothetical protein
MEQNPAGVPSPIQEDEVEDVNAQEEGLGAVLAAFDQIGQPPTLLVIKFWSIHSFTMN